MSLRAEGMSREQARQRRTLLLGVAAIVGIVALGRGVPAWRAALAESRAGAAALHADLAAAEAALAWQATVRDTLAARAARLAALSATLAAGPDEGAAGRALAAMVSGAAAGAEVRLTSTSVVETASRDARGTAVGAAVGERRAAPAAARGDTVLLRPVAVRVVGTGDIRGVATLLQTLERGPMRLTVRTLAITQPEVAAEDDRVEMLQVELVVEGLAVARRDGVASMPARGAR